MQRFNYERQRTIATWAQGISNKPRRISREGDPGAYCFQLPDGTRGVHNAGASITLHDPIGDTLVETHPPSAIFGLQGYRHNGVVYMAGQSANDGQAWLYRHDTKAWTAKCPSHGVRVCGFGNGALYVTVNGVTIRRIGLTTNGATEFNIPLTSQGIRYVSENGSVHLGDETLFDGVVHEFTDRGDLRVGQGHNGGLVIRIRRADGTFDDRLLEPGEVLFPVFERGGDACGVGMWKPRERESVCYTFTRAEVETLPKVQQPEPEPEPEPSMAQGITDAQFEDLKKIRNEILGTADDIKVTPQQIGKILNRFAYKHRNDDGAKLGLEADDSDPKAFQPVTNKPIWAGIRIIDKNGVHWGQDIVGAASAGYFRPTRGEAGGPASITGPHGWVDPVNDTAEPDEPQGFTHKYIGGGNDTGTCDTCGKSRFDSVHKIPQSYVKHAYDGGEQDTGVCDICQKERSNAIHDMNEPEEPTVDKHAFVGSDTAKFCSECGRARTDAVHQIEQPEPGNFNDARIVAKLDEVIAAEKATTAAIAKLNSDLQKAVKELAALLPLIIKTPSKKKTRGRA